MPRQPVSTRVLPVNDSMFGVVAVGSAWLGIGAVLIRRGRFPDRAAARVRRASSAGVALQCIAFGVPLVPLAGHGAGWSAAGVVVLLLSVWLFHGSVRALGRHWSLVARVRGEHELVTGGPYAQLRHPIYVAMAGMILGSGALLGSVGTVFVALVVYGVGTVVRVRFEEALLRDAHGPAWEGWAERVPGWIPRPAARSRAPISMLAAAADTSSPVPVRGSETPSHDRPDTPCCSSRRPEGLRAAQRIAGTAL